MPSVKLRKWKKKVTACHCITANEDQTQIQNFVPQNLVSASIKFDIRPMIPLLIANASMTWVVQEHYFTYQLSIALIVDIAKQRYHDVEVLEIESNLYIACSEKQRWDFLRYLWLFPINSLC